ncbi:glycoside hydrolase family 43 protein [Oleiharenicola lentus]|uniref:glycoside hydrolase family 43 protein n=1 Tax=Oleiharenicola lentus TaxID=2508720 RepID=UPI003F67A358
MLPSISARASVAFLVGALGFQSACATPAALDAKPRDQKPAPRYLSEPLIRHVYTADAAAHVFDGRLYLYPSHDIPGVIDNTDGNHYAMRDYHIFSMEKVGAPVTDHGVAFSLEDVPWASRQLWAPDVARANGRYYFYFPARDKAQVFRIGVAVGDSPTGPFKPQPEPIDGAFSIDPAAFRDDDGTHYLYFGGLAGGQLQRWSNNRYTADAPVPTGDQPAAAPRVARLRDDLLGLAEPAREIVLLDPAGRPLLAGDENRRFFEGAWIHRHNGVYYFSYSTGTTHQIVYATGDSPYGPFTYRGVILKPVQGWTTHQSIVKHDGKWWLFYHDAQLSGQSNLRNVKVTELHHEADGSIRALDPMRAN